MSTGMVIHYSTRPNGDKGYSVTSWDNGASYLLRDERARYSVFFQGDDALQFEKEKDAAIEAFGLHDGLSRMVDQYAEIMDQEIDD